jgi:hypothetical protein
VPRRSPLGRVAVAHLGSDISRAYVNGALGEDDYQRLWEAIEARRQEARAARQSAQPVKASPKRQRSPDKQRSIERRRRLARASPVPPELVDKFSQGEHAVMTVVAGEIQRAGACSWFIDRIAAVAGVCRTLVQNALRKAREFGLLFSEERRRRGQKSLTNIVRVLKKTWGTWLRRIGFRKFDNPGLWRASKAERRWSRRTSIPARNRLGEEGPLDCRAPHRNRPRVNHPGGRGKSHVISREEGA